MSIIAAYCVPHPPLIIPAVGGGEERKILKTINAYRSVAKAIATLAPDTIILTTPHLTMYQDYFHIAPGQGARGDLSKFGQPGETIAVRYDEELIRRLSLTLAEDGFPGGTEGATMKELDHASFVPLHFIQQEYKNFNLVRIGLSGLSLSLHYRLGMYIQAEIEALDRRCVFIASGDLSHRLLEDGPYGFDPNGPVYDQAIMKILSEGTFKDLLTMSPDLYEGAGECGHRSFTIMAGSLDRRSVRAEALSYEGPFGVGYGIVAIHPAGIDEQRNFLDQFEQETLAKTALTRKTASPQVKLASAVILAKLENRKFNLRDYAKSEALPDSMTAAQAGVFVSLKKEGQLRGCIGTIAPTTASIAQEIERNAIEAAFADPRFRPLEIAEFQALTVSVDVLAPPEPINSKAELDPVNYGVIVTNGRRRGLLLPNLAGVDTVDQQIEIAKSKAGISPAENCSLERFKVVRYE